MTVKKKSVGARLNRMIDGHLKSKTEVKRALKEMEQIADEIAEIEERHGLVEMRAKAVALKKAAMDYMVENELATIELDKYGRYARVITSNSDGRFIATEDELGADMPSDAISLRRIFRRKFGKDGFSKMYYRATKRIADPEGLQDMMREGLITDEEVAPAYVTKPRAPYLRIFGKDES